MKVEAMPVKDFTFSSAEAARLAKILEKSEHFDSLYREAWKLIEETEMYYFDRDFMKMFTGGVFHVLAYLYLRDRYSFEKVHSGEEALTYFGNLYPDAEVIPHPFGLSSLNISVPDGLVFRRKGQGGKVRFVCEYTTDEESLNGKHDRFQQLKIDFPEKFNRARLMFVVPNNMKIPREISRDSMVRVDLLPFSSYEFGGYIDYLIYEYQKSGVVESIYGLHQQVMREPTKEVFKNSHV